MTRPPRPHNKYTGSYDVWNKGYDAAVNPPVDMFLRERIAIAVVENSWILPKTTPNIIDLKCEVIGSKGALYLDTSHNRTLEKYTETEATYPDFLVMPTIYGQQAGFAAESIRHFIDCVLHDRQPRVTGLDGLEVTRVIQAIEESVRSGNPVEVS